jgi:sugar phosphate isomerase/epimerase
MNRRQFVAGLAASLQLKAAQLPANKNVKWALSLALWNHFDKPPFTEILDIMKDTGFIGIRLTQYPGFLKTYDVTPAQIEKEISKRDLHVVTISFNGPAHDPAQQAKVLASAKDAMNFLKGFGANHLVVFSPSRLKPGPEFDAGFKAMCDCFNRIGSLAGEMGFHAGLHNHLGQMAEKPDEILRCMAMTDPKLFKFSPDTAHLLLGGSNVVEMFKKYKYRLMFMDYKDAHPTKPAEGKRDGFLNSIYDLGDGDVDFPGCHRVLKEIGYKGWICVDLDTARKGPRVSYERCGAYVVKKLEPIYV